MGAIRDSVVRHLLGDGRIHSALIRIDLEQGLGVRATLNGKPVAPLDPALVREWLGLILKLGVTGAEFRRFTRETGAVRWNITWDQALAALRLIARRANPGRKVRSKETATGVEVLPVGKRLRQEQITSMIVELQKGMGESIADFSTPAKMAGLLAARFRIKAPSKNTVAKNPAFRAMIRGRGRPRRHHEDDDE